jgi:hypothetical protein
MQFRANEADLGLAVDFDPLIDLRLSEDLARKQHGGRASHKRTARKQGGHLNPPLGLQIYEQAAGLSMPDRFAFAKRDRRRPPASRCC